jgi:hypothetical protein
MYTSDGEHQLSQSLLNGVASTFESRLAFLSHPYPSDTGERVCIATATYISANSSETNSSTAVGKSALIHIKFKFSFEPLLAGETHFAMYSSGEAVSITCIDSSGIANLVQWINSTGTVLTSSSSTAVTLTIASVTDQHHGNDYICRIHSSGVTRDLNYTIVILGKYIEFCDRHFETTSFLYLQYHQVHSWPRSVLQVLALRELVVATHLLVLLSRLQVV